jgi:hypothetical protein
MASKTNRKQARSAGQWYPVQPEGEGQLLLTLHLPLSRPLDGYVAGGGVEEREGRQDEKASGSHVIVLDLD